MVEKTDANKVQTGTISSSDQITFSNVTWSDGTASVTLTGTNSDFYIQYQVVAENGSYSDSNWTASTSKGSVTVSNIAVNSVIYVRYYDGTNYGAYGSFNLIDYVGPTVEISTSDILATSVTVTVDTAEDYQSGMPSSPTYIYQYQKSGSTTWYTAKETTDATYTITGLDYSTDYTIRVRVADNAGTYGAGVAEITTDSIIGYYVAYTPDSGTYTKIKSSSTYAGTTYNSVAFTTDTSLNWQIWSIDDDTLTLISDDVSNSGGYYTNGQYYLCLNWWLGYNNGVYLLNEICETLYSNSSIGAEGRSIKIEDVEPVLNMDTAELKQDAYVAYEKTVTYTSSSFYYPYMLTYEASSSEWSSSITYTYVFNEDTGYYEVDGAGVGRSYQGGLMTATYWQTSYSMTLQNSAYIVYNSTTSYYDESVFKDVKYCKLLEGTSASQFWYASRCIGSYDGWLPLFYLFTAGDTTAVCYVWMQSGANQSINSNPYHGIRPVVEISLSSVSLDTSTNTGETSSTAFELVTE